MPDIQLQIYPGPYPRAAISFERVGSDWVATVAKSTLFDNESGHEGEAKELPQKEGSGTDSSLPDPCSD